MLYAFHIKNFRSIKEATLDLSFKEGKAPNGYRELEDLVFLEHNKKTRLVPCLAMYGANASGKTNIVRALYIFQQIVTMGIVNLLVLSQIAPNKIIHSGEFTSFELTFFQNSKYFKYQISFNKIEISNETLYIDNKLIFSLNGDKEDFSGLPQRNNYTVERLREIRNVECLVDHKQKKTFLSRLATQYTGLDTNVTNAFKEIDGIEILQANDPPLSFLFRNNRVIYKEEIEEILKKITKLLSKLDIGITKLTYNEEPFSLSTELPLNARSVRVENGKFFIESIHSYRNDINGNEVEFNFNEEESNGTRILASLLVLCLSALEQGKILVVDELDRALHPALFIEIVRLFKSKRYNKHNSQLIFTAHETGILDADLLRISEVCIVSKTLQKGTETCRIADFDGVRNILNFRKQYLNGSFGGIPHPYI